MYVSAFSAIPENLFIALEHSVLQNIPEKFPVPFFMTFLCRSNSFKCGRDVFKSFFLCCFGESGIKIAPFLMLPFSCGEKIIFCSFSFAGRIRCSYFNHTTFKKPEESFGMLLFL